MVSRIFKFGLVEFWTGGGGPASTAMDDGLLRRGGRGGAEAGLVVILLDGGVVDGVRDGRGGARDVARVTLAEADVLLGGGRKVVLGLVFRFAVLRGGGGGGGGPSPLYGSQFVFANGTLQDKTEEFHKRRRVRLKRTWCYGL